MEDAWIRTDWRSTDNTDFYLPLLSFANIISNKFCKIFTLLSTVGANPVRRYS